MSRENIFTPGKVAVVTGAALGIGRALSIRLAEMGLSVVMADLRGDDFSEAIADASCASPGGQQSVMGVATDVSDPQQVEDLKLATLEAFQRVDLLVNNAVTRVGRGFDTNIEQWRRAVDVNLWGPIHGVRAFLPAMIESPDPGAIINVGSKQGITNPPGHPIYNITKSALKTYTEALQHDLRTRPDNQSDACVTAHLLIPGWTTTGKAEHKPGAWLPEQVVGLLLTRMASNDFYILCPDGEVTPDMDHRRVQWAAGDIIENRPPLSRWHADFAVRAKEECS